MTLPDGDGPATASRRVVERLSDGFGTRTRVLPQTELLERRSAITGRQARAGAEIYRCWALGIMDVRDGEPTGNGADPDGYAIAQVEAARTYRMIRDAVGPRLWPLVFAVCVEEWSPSRFANERAGGMHKMGAMALLRLGLDLAADALGDV